KWGGRRRARGKKSTSPIVRPARGGIGNDVELRVDAGLCWDTATALRRARQFEQFNLTWLEEPLHPDNLAGYGRLSSQSPVRIAAGAGICGIKEFQQMMDVSRLHVVPADVTPGRG